MLLIIGAVAAAAAAGAVIIKALDTELLGSIPKGK